MGRGLEHGCRQHGLLLGAQLCHRGPQQLWGLAATTRVHADHADHAAHAAHAAAV